MAKLAAIREVQEEVDFEFPDDKLARFRELMQRTPQVPWTIEEEREYLSLRQQLVDAEHNAWRLADAGGIYTREIVGGEVWECADGALEPLIDW